MSDWTVRIIVEEEQLRNDLHPFQDVYIDLNLSHQPPLEEVFDAVAQHFVGLMDAKAETLRGRFRTCVRVNGIEHTEPARVIEVKKEMDRMRVRHPEVTNRLSSLGHRYRFCIGVIFSNSQDTPFEFHCSMPIVWPDEGYQADSSGTNAFQRPEVKALLRAMG